MASVVSTALIVIVSVAILDGIWISLNFPMYNRMFSAVQGAPMRVNMLGAVGAYIFIFLSFMYLVLPRLQNNWDCLREGGLFGLCAYGIYNFTNLALFKDYSITVALLDTLWGGALYTIVSLIVLNVAK